VKSGVVCYNIGMEIHIALVCTHTGHHVYIEGVDPSSPNLDGIWMGTREDARKAGWRFGKTEAHWTQEVHAGEYNMEYRRGWMCPEHAHLLLSEE
jgi:hypothetical protein